MPIPTPKLDTRNFQDLMNQARRIFKDRTKTSDLDDSDPATVLLEVFAHLTESLIHQVNQIPDKVYVELLNLMGVSLRPPRAAEIQFSLSSNESHVLTKGTKITVTQPPQEAVIFQTIQDYSVPASKSESVIAINAAYIENELVGVGTGYPGLVLKIKNPPIIRNDVSRCLEVKVESDSRPAKPNEKHYEIWNEVKAFGLADPGSKSFVVDRTEGLIIFAPLSTIPEPYQGALGTAKALAQIPGIGKEIRVSYFRGGGKTYLNEGALNEKPSPISIDGIPDTVTLGHITVSNGEDIETLEDAKLRAPIDFFTQERAVTKSDYEYLIKKHTEVEKVFVRSAAQTWKYAEPGTVEIFVVPPIDPGVATGLGLKKRLQPEEKSGQPNLLKEIDKILSERQVMGAKADVKWANYKSIKIEAKIKAHENHDPNIKERLKLNLTQKLSPVSVNNNAGWSFGRTLHTSDIHEWLMQDSGVAYIKEAIKINYDYPDKTIRFIRNDKHQSKVWFTATRRKLYRSENDGLGWERIYPQEESADYSDSYVENPNSPDDEILALELHPKIPGLLAILTQEKLCVSQNSGETFTEVAVGLPDGHQYADISWSYVSSSHEVTMLIACFKPTWDQGEDNGSIRLLAFSPGQLSVKKPRETTLENGNFVRVNSSEQGFFGCIKRTGNDKTDFKLVIGTYNENGQASPDTWKSVNLENLQNTEIGPNTNPSLIWRVPRLAIDNKSVYVYEAVSGYKGLRCWRYLIDQNQVHEQGILELDKQAEEKINGSQAIFFKENNVYFATNDGLYEIEKSKIDKNIDKNERITLNKIGETDPYTIFAFDISEDNTMIAALALSKNSNKFQPEHNSLYSISNESVRPLRDSYFDEVTLPNNYLFVSDIEIEIEK